MVLPHLFMGEDEAAIKEAAFHQQQQRVAAHDRKFSAVVCVIALGNVSAYLLSWDVRIEKPSIMDYGIFSFGLS